MASIEWLFCGHPESVGETYLEHMGAAGGFGSRMILAGFACLLHGVFPFLFVRTGSNAISHLHNVMVTNRVRPNTRRNASQGWTDASAFI